ncbi:hypothetical protein Nepgr_025340 [Nepenthes gracilis]|uniref:Uncharacterized protein n=1 Tax=Nepenthes gracilis TaxID=150966 RepID=A0AAD3T691_NEPGR|nr:hypothetical protein Nepgr_025340 [Nepenthes gracilis]
MHLRPLCSGWIGEILQWTEFKAWLAWSRVLPGSFGSFSLFPWLRFGMPADVVVVAPLGWVSVLVAGCDIAATILESRDADCLAGSGEAGIDLGCGDYIGLDAENEFAPSNSVDGVAVNWWWVRSPMQSVVLYHTEAASSEMKKLQPAAHAAIHRVYAVGLLLRGGWHLLQGPSASAERDVSGGGSSCVDDDALYQIL